MATLAIKSDIAIRWLGMYDEVSAAYVNDATVTFSILDFTTKIPLSGMSNIPMAFQTGTNGNYVGVLDKAQSSTLVEGTKYWIAVTAASQGRDEYREFLATAGFRGAT